MDGFYWGKLIMFESTDPAITDIGGIAAGMSGSPIYVNVDGTDRIVGAVSYGDWFTLRGTGLATPIEYMTSLQDQYAAAAQAARAPVRRHARPAGRDLRRRRQEAGPRRRHDRGRRGRRGHASARRGEDHRPLERQHGLPQAGDEARGQRPDGALGRAPPPAPDATPALEAGSPCGVVFSTGHYALSVLGTVTYVDGDAALLFGHPILGGYSGLDLGLGPIEGRLTGATVDAVWPSTNTPYKMMTPADAKGLAVQDRSAGVVARLSGAMATFPVTTHGSLNGGAAVTDVTDLGQWFATVVLARDRRLLGRLPRDHYVHRGGGALPRPGQRSRSSAAPRPPRRSS